MKTAVIELRIELDPVPGAYNDPEDWVTVLNHGALSSNYKVKAKLLRVEGPFEEDGDICFTFNKGNIRGYKS